MRYLVLAILLVSLTAYGDECERVAVWRDGRPAGTTCRSAAALQGLTLIDLGDDWVPPILDAGPDGHAPSYRQTYLALAQERLSEAGLDGALASRDRYLELYGILPTFSVVRSRLADEARHACHARIDDAAFADAPDGLSEEPAARGRARLATARALRSELERERTRRKLADLAALAAVDAYHRRVVERLARLEIQIAAVRAVQAHLACDGLLQFPPVDAAYTWQTSNAVEVFQRRAMVLPTGRLDAQTYEAFAMGSRELDLRAALRVLRGRVAVAAGLVEDGSAGTGELPVLGRLLVPAATLRARGSEALAHAAADLRSPATEAAARALGWRDAGSVAAFFAAQPPRYAAVALPAAPAYHAPDMALEVEIESGTGARRPALTLYAVREDERIALVRWPTTVGGWQPQQIDGEVVTRWKGSPLGPRIWRDVYVGPRWLPPSSTPDRELVRPSGQGYVLARELLGPSYRAAFGLVAFVHLVVERERGQPAYWDQGIRTHGTGNLSSLADGTSHGCHRLLGYHIVQLADFVLAHRPFVRRGATPTWYRRTVQLGGRQTIAIDSLGYRIELEPPIAVDVHAPRR